MQIPNYTEDRILQKQHHTKMTDEYLFLSSFFQWFLAVSCLVSRALAGTRSSPVNLAMTCTGRTTSHCAQSPSRLCVTAWGPISTSIYTTKMGRTFVCGACHTSTLLVNQSVARLTCFTECYFIQKSNSTSWKSHTGGPGNGLVSHQEMDVILDLFL